MCRQSKSEREPYSITPWCHWANDKIEVDVRLGFNNSGSFLMCLTTALPFPITNKLSIDRSAIPVADFFNVNCAVSKKSQVGVL